MVKAVSDIKFGTEAEKAVERLELKQWLEESENLVGGESAIVLDCNGEAGD